MKGIKREDQQLIKVKQFKELLVKSGIPLNRVLK
jgi:hypothetical protein